MLRRLIRDESGVALGLAIIMIVLIGVMGAGLLVFVRNDLLAVVEVNQGQKALESAEAGAAAAKRQLASDNVRRHYDSDASNDCAPGQRVGEDWSPAATTSNANCSNTAVSKPSGPGVRKNFGDGRFVATIQCYDQTGDATDLCAGISESAPGSETADERRYFKITSTGYSPADGSGAARTVQTIHYTEPLNYPTAYYSFKNIRFVGNTTISGVSFFAKGNIEGTKSGSVNIDRSTKALYGDWNTTLFTPPSELNTVSRTNSAGTRLQGVGFGAEGLVCATNCSSSAADGYNDYDSTTGTKGKNLKFEQKPEGSQNAPNSSGIMSYPFDLPSSLGAELPLDIWEEDARAQGTYKTPGEIGNKIDNANWPSTQTPHNIFFVEAGGQTVNIDYRVNLDPTTPQGVIVVRNGNLSINNASNGFKGIIVVTGDGTNTGNYKSTGNDTVTGFVVAEGTMEIGGTVEPSVAVGEFADTPGYNRINLWSWRECYSVGCS